MTTGFSYNGGVTGTINFLTHIATMAVVASTDTNYLAILPAAITYAENRIYRDIDLLNTQSSKYSFNLTVGSRSLTVPTGTFITTQQINVITPISAVTPDTGTRNPCLPVTKEFLDIVYGSSAGAGVPQYYVPFNDNVFYFGPFPDQAYMVEIVGTIRPASLSATNTTTFLSLYMPDLMVMATMVYISAYQRNFSGMTANDPQMPVNYEAQYQTLLKGVVIEEVRKKYESVGWTSQSPSPISTPSRSG